MPKKTEKKLAPKATKAAPKKAKTIAKSADTGKIVSKEFAKANPKTTFETKAKPKTKLTVIEDVPAGRPIPDITPVVGEKFLLDGFIASVTSTTPFIVVRHEVENGVITDKPLDFKSLEGHNCLRVKQGEAMRMLNGG